MAFVTVQHTAGVNVLVALGMTPLEIPALVVGLMVDGMNGRTMMTEEQWAMEVIDQMTKKIKSDGSTASYYELPPNAGELQHLIAYKNMNAQIGEIFRACYRYGEVEHSEKIRDAKKMRFYVDAEIERLEKYEN